MIRSTSDTESLLESLQNVIDELHNKKKELNMGNISESNSKDWELLINKFHSLSKKLGTRSCSLPTAMQLMLDEEPGTVIKLTLCIKKGIVVGGGLKHESFAELSYDGIKYDETELLDPPIWNKVSVLEWSVGHPNRPKVMTITIFKKKWTNSFTKLVGTVDIDINDTIIPHINKGIIEKEFRLTPAKKNLTLGGSVVLSFQLQAIESKMKKINLLDNDQIIDKLSLPLSNGLAAKLGNVVAITISFKWFGEQYSISTNHFIFILEELLSHRKYIKYLLFILFLIVYEVMILTFQIHVYQSLRALENRLMTYSMKGEENCR